jgi:molecular chaperone GrpE
MKEETTDRTTNGGGPPAGEPSPTLPPETEAVAGTTAAEEDLTRKLEEAQKAAEGYRDQFLRKAAEFENFKRRTDAEYLSLVRNANESLLSSLIPVVEDFARSFKAGKDQKEGEAFYRGVELIYQKFTKVLEQLGLVPFESLGKSFDVSYHDALLQLPRADVPPGTVIEEVERGYMYQDRVLRHAKVIVSSAPEAEAGGGMSPEAAQNEETRED